MTHVNASVKSIISVKTIMVRIIENVFWENGKYLKNIADDSKIVCDKIINFVDIVQINVTSIISDNVSNKFWW